MAGRPVNAVKGKQGFQPTGRNVPAPTASEVASGPGADAPAGPDDGQGGIGGMYAAFAARQDAEPAGNAERIRYADRIVTDQYTLTERAGPDGSRLWTARVHATGAIEEFDTLGAADLWADRQIGTGGPGRAPAGPEPEQQGGNRVINRSGDRLVTERYTVRRERLADGSRVYGVVIQGSGQVREFDSEREAVRWADEQI